MVSSTSIKTQTLKNDHFQNANKTYTKICIIWSSKDFEIMQCVQQIKGATRILTKSGRAPQDVV